MGRYTGPKNKLSRREGFDLFNKGSKLRRPTLAPGMTVGKRPGKVSEFGRQLRAKQLFKRIYGIREKQMVGYIHKAGRQKMNIGDALMALVEKRLDNVVYRLGWVPTRNMARQLVSHYHILVDGKKINVPSYSVKPGEVIALKEKIQQIPTVLEMQKEKASIPTWLKKDNFRGSVQREPTPEDVAEPITIRDVIEFYSR